MSEISEEVKNLRLALSSQGRRGALPEWWSDLWYSQQLSIPPWEVPNAPPEWLERARVAYEAKEWAEQELARRNEAQARELYRGGVYTKVTP